MFERGLDIEALTLALSGDAEEAWLAAEPYYMYAKLRGHAEAAYRFAQHAKERFGVGEFVYGIDLERAAKLGHKQAIRDFVDRYDKIKAKTITKDAWRRKKKQEKLYFQCCKALADEGDTHALWKLGTCYLFGTGVKQDESKGIIMRDQAMKQWELDDEDWENLNDVQEFFKNSAIEDKPSSSQYFWKAAKYLFSIKKRKGIKK